MTKELAVAAVTVLSFFLICGRGGGGAVLRAAVLILTLLSVIGLVVRRVRLTAVAFTVRIAGENERASQKSAYVQDWEPAGQSKVSPADAGWGADGTLHRRGWRLGGREAQTLMGLHKVWGWSSHLWEGLGSHCRKVCGGCWGQCGARKRREGGHSCMAAPRSARRWLPMVLLT